MLLSSDQFLSYRAKLKKYLGVGEKELDEQINEILKEIPKPKEKEMASTFSEPHIKDYEVGIFPRNCSIDPESELHWKIKDTIEWIMVKVICNSPCFLDDISRDSNSQSVEMIKAMKDLLEQELLTNIVDLKVNTFKDWQTYSEVLKIGVAITLDQSYIDNYQDIVNQQMVDNAIKAIQTQHDISEIPTQVNTLTAAYFVGTGAGSVIGKSGFNKQVPVKGEIQYDIVTMQNKIFDGTTWRPMQDTGNYWSPTRV